MADNRLSFKAEQTDAVSLSVYSVGYEKCKGLHSWGSGVRDHYLLHHIISGKGVYKTPLHTFELKAGDTFLIYPYTEITYTADKDEPWEYYWVGFNGADAEHLLDRTDFSRDYPVVSTDFGNSLCENLQTIYQLSGRENASVVKMTGQLYLTLGLLIEKTVHTKTVQNVAGNYVNKAEKFISVNYPLNISIETIADFIGVSRTTLYRAFMECEGISPVEFLCDVRIKQACHLLRETDLPVSAVARSVGYEDKLYFSRAFHKKKGISPSAYRFNNVTNQSHSDNSQPLK